MTYLVGALTLLLVSCGIEKPQQFIDDEFEAYVDLFESIHKRKITSSVKFAKMKDNYVGFCRTYTDGTKLIEINPEAWQNYDEETREVLFFHEAGHCELGLKHNNNIVDFCPVSIMKSSVFNPWEIANCYQPNRQKYLENL